MSKRELVGAEAYCPECEAPSKFFLPKAQHLCEQHGWFKLEEPASDLETPDDTDDSRPRYCSYLLRNRHLCSVKVEGSKLCGYHASSKQKDLEIEFKRTILSILRRALESSDTDPEILLRLQDAGFLESKSPSSISIPEDYEAGAALHMLMKIFQELVE